MGIETIVAVGGAVIGGASSAADRSQNSKALKTQQKQNASNARFLSKQSEKAAVQATGLFESSAKNQQVGMQRALDILGQTIPQQLSAFQQGNTGAQQQLAAGLPQIQNALLGLPTDLSALQPKQIQFDPNFSQQTAPMFELPVDSLRRADAPNRLRTQNAGFQNMGLTGNFVKSGPGTNRPLNLNFGGFSIL